MYDKILVAVDHSEASDRALLAARDLALLSKGEVWILHLREREIITKTSVVMTDETEREATSMIEAAVDKLTAAGVKAHGHVGTTIFGYAARSIVDDAIEHDVDVIVMGSRGRGELYSLLLGSVSRHVLQASPIPVLVVHLAPSAGDRDDRSSPPAVETNSARVRA